MPVTSRRSAATAAIIEALGYTPVAAGDVAMPAGSAAAPGMPFSTNPEIGFYLNDSKPDRLGIAAGGKHLATIGQYGSGVVGVDGAILSLGRKQTISAGWAYMSTIVSPPQTIDNVAGGVMFCNMFVSNLTLTANGSYVLRQYNVEMDKLEIDLGGDATAATVPGACNVIVRIPIAKAGVTLTDASGIEFGIPNSADVTGTHTNTALIIFPNTSAGPTSNYTGLRFDADYNGNHISTRAGVDLTINSARSINLKTSNLTTLQIGANSGTNYLKVSAQSAPTIQAEGSARDIALFVVSKGASPISLRTGGSMFEQVRINHTENSVNPLTLTGGASGANPRISASAANLTLGTARALATDATAGFVLMPAMAGKPSGAPTGSGLGAIPFVYDTAANKWWAYNGSWRSIALV